SQTSSSSASRRRRFGRLFSCDNTWPRRLSQFPQGSFACVLRCDHTSGTNGGFLDRKECAHFAIIICANGAATENGKKLINPAATTWDFLKRQSLRSVAGREGPRRRARRQAAA